VKKPTKSDDSLSPVKLLSELIQLDTSNPPGNEEIAVQYLQTLLDDEGIPSEVFMPEPKRANIIARIKGKKKGRPVVLLGHIDVVPAHDEGWDAPPFSGAIRDGFIYGRGAIDMKSQVICHLIAFINLKRAGIVPERDMIFLATADEEVSGKLGAEYMFQKVDDLGDASFVLSEGGFVMEDEGRLHARISVGEKQVCQFTIRATGTGGHGSMPRGNNANQKVIEAAHRILKTEFPFKPTRIVTAYLEGLLKGRKMGRTKFTYLKDALDNKAFRAYVATEPVLNALLRNTVTLTMLRSGEKINVIPTESAASFDARIFPEVKHDSFLSEIGRIAGPEVEIIPIQKTYSVPSSFRTPYFKNTAAAVRRIHGDIPVLPFLTTGATDLRHFRARGVPAYGFFPVRLREEEHMRMHSINERLAVESLEEGMRCMDDIVRFLASHDPEK
jgi:acetylornithine deacetylase/succinyl-diaminopimelate desuccinylase-like protein